MAAVRSLKSAAPMQSLGGWVLDEKKAYRQVPINPDHRKYSVITMKNPDSGSPSFFVMVGDQQSTIITIVGQLPLMKSWSSSSSWWLSASMMTSMGSNP